MNKNIFSEKHCGVTFGFYAKNGYFSSAKAKDEVDEMAKTGVNWIVLVVTVMQEHYYSTRQFRDFANTPNDIELKEIIDYIHGKGIKVQLRPMLECFDGGGRLAVYFPPDSVRIPGLSGNYCQPWFDSMTKRSVYYARIAQMTGCEMFCLDSELDSVIDFNNEWKAVISAIREVYSGPVTSCHTLAVVDFENVLKNKEHWFYDLDALSLSDYVKGADGDGFTVEQMAEFMMTKRDKFRRIAALYQKPILFGEIGCTSTYGAAKNPSGFSPKTPYCEEEQANYLEAYLRVFSQESWWHGMYWWKWDEQVARPWIIDKSQGDRGFVVRGKKAQAVMEKWFKKLCNK